jgi:WD40 repeat protein
MIYFIQQYITMWIEKPAWIRHGDKHQIPILSIDIQPLMERFITGAMDSTVQVWNFKGIIDKDEKELKLATLSQHCGPVNCVRWNPNTQSFASGSDDKLIIIWEQKEGGLSDNLEEWRGILTLQGHLSDVKDLNWSRTGKYLASGSIDNKVIVWNVEGKQFYPFQILSGHESYVSSVVFDPFDKQLVSLGEDKKLILWNTSDWKQIKVLDQNLSNNPSQVLKRFAFTPDARNLILPGPKKSNFKFMASVLSTEDYLPEKYLVGHLQPISVVSSSPVLYKVEGSLHWAVACGGFDSTVSIWRSIDTKPIAIRDLFSCAVSDISWSSDGKIVLGCSNDGTIAVIYLGNELGDIVSQREMHTFMYELYSEIPPEPIILHTLRKPLAKKLEPKPMNEQKEIRLQNGKRRIQPVLLSTPGPAGSVPVSSGFSSYNTSTSMPISIMSSPIAPTLPSLQLNKIEFKVHLSRVLCSSECEDYSESKCNLNLLHISKLINFSGDIVLEAMQFDIDHYKSAIRLRKGNKQVWINYLQHTVQYLAGSDYFAAVYTEEGYLYCYKIAGMQALPEMKVSSMKFMESAGFYLAILTKENFMHVYNLEEKKECIRCEVNDLDVKSITVSDLGCPKIETKSGENFIYDKSMNLWMRIKNSGLEYFKTDGWNPTPLSSELVTCDLDSYLHMSISQVETQLLRLKVLNYKEEYAYTVKKYVNMLIDAQDIYKLIDITQDLKKTSNDLYNQVRKILESHEILAKLSI